MVIFQSGREVNAARMFISDQAGTGNMTNTSLSNFAFLALNLNTSNPNVNTSWIDQLSNETIDDRYDDYKTEDPYIFDRLYVRVIFIVLYTIVFCFCFFGNLMVILVVTLHWRMRNITKFCLANLAFADLCVGVFCVYQNLSVYLINSWVLGEFLCKMYQFINALSHTAAVLILVVICVERYLAILHPFQAKQIMTINRLRVLIIAVWVVSAIYCSPRLYYIVSIQVLRLDGTPEIICVAQRTLYDSKTYDMIHFFLLFLLPLIVISILYTRVGITLWRSSKNHHLQVPLSQAGSTSTNSANAAGGNLLTISGSNSETSSEFENETTISSPSPVPTPVQSKIKIKNKTKAKSHVPSVRFTKLRRRKEINGSGQNKIKKANGVKSTALSNINANSNSSFNGKLKLGQPPLTSNSSNTNTNTTANTNNSSSSYRVTVENTCYVVGLNINEGKISDVIETESDADAEFLQPAPAVTPPFSSTTSVSLCSTECSLKNGGKRLSFSSDGPCSVSGGTRPRPRRSSSSASAKNCNINGTTLASAGVNANSNIPNNSISKTCVIKRLSRGSVNFRRASSVLSLAGVGRRKSERKKSESQCQVKQVRSGRDALKSRQTVVKMMIVIVFTFALCNFPFHLRKMFQYWWPNYDYVSISSTLATPLTYLIMYANCAINPLIYAFMSKAFRSSFKDLLCCRWKKSFELGNQHQSTTLSQTGTAQSARKQSRN